MLPEGLQLTRAGCPTHTCCSFTALAHHTVLAATEKDGGHARDNRDYVACDTHQQLSHKQLEAMKSSGMAGEEIISALMAGSATYSKKNAFTQQKWLANKAKKYVLRLHLSTCSLTHLPATPTAPTTQVHATCHRAVTQSSSSV